MLLEKIVILGKLKILSKHHTSYDVLSDHLTDKGSLITSDLLSDNEQLLLNRIPPVVVRDDIGSALIIGITGKVPFNSFRSHDIVHINIL